VSGREIARHVIGCHVTQRRSFTMRLMMSLGRADTAHHVQGCHVPQKPRGFRRRLMAWRAISGRPYLRPHPACPVRQRWPPQQLHFGGHVRVQRGQHLGPGRYCSPRHRKSVNSRFEGSRQRLRMCIYDVAGSICRPYQSLLGDKCLALSNSPLPRPKARASCAEGATEVLSGVRIVDGAREVRAHLVIQQSLAGGSLRTSTRIDIEA